MTEPCNMFEMFVALTGEDGETIFLNVGKDNPIISISEFDKFSIITTLNEVVYVQESLEDIQALANDRLNDVIARVEEATKRAKEAAQREAEEQAIRTKELFEGANK